MMSPFGLRPSMVWYIIEGLVYLARDAALLSLMSHNKISSSFAIGIYYESLQNPADTFHALSCCMCPTIVADNNKTLIYVIGDVYLFNVFKAG